MIVNEDILSTLPLFIGLNLKELREIVHDTPMSLRHHKKGSTIVEGDTPCSTLIFVIDGWMEMVSSSDDRSYCVTELIQAPQCLEPSKLFGLTQRYRTTYMAYNPCISIAISKESLQGLLDKYFIVRLNYLNMLCRASQRYEHIPWQVMTDDLEKRIITFFKQHCVYPAGKKTFKMKMTQLATQVNDSRLDVSRVLNKMQDDEKIILLRGRIEIPALQLL